MLSSTVGARGFSPELVNRLEVVAPQPAALADGIGDSLSATGPPHVRARQIVETSTTGA